MRKKRIKRIVMFVLAFVTIFSFSGIALASYGSFDNFPIRRQGDVDGGINSVDNYVKALQTVIKYNYSDLQNDGIFGSTTYNKVRSYQSANNLTVDGIVGSQTWINMDSKLVGDYNGYYYYDFYIRKPNGSHTNTYFFSCQGYNSGSTARWWVYKAAPGDAPGQWYTLD